MVAGLRWYWDSIDSMTHVAMGYSGIVRSIPGTTLVLPLDTIESHLASRAGAQPDESAFLRIGNNTSPVIFEEDHDFNIGKGNELTQHRTDLAILASMLAVRISIEARERLEMEGTDSRILDVHMPKPLGATVALQAGRGECEVLTCEEYNITVGQRGAVAVRAASGFLIPDLMIATPDRFSESARPEELHDLCGLTNHAETDAAHRCLQREETFRKKIASCDAHAVSVPDRI
jgi:transketolase